MKLRKFGKFVDDYSGVSIDMGSDDVTVDYDAATGEFTIEDIIADTPYTLTVSKPGYQDYTINVQVGEDENVVLGGSRGIVLEYEIFESLLGWDWEKIDFSNANAENATLGYSGPGGTFSVLTKDSFEEVARNGRPQLELQYQRPAHAGHHPPVRRWPARRGALS